MATVIVIMTAHVRYVVYQLIYKYPTVSYK